MASDDFGQIVKPTAAIRHILDSYPFSVGILRELLQNSDDAGATRQVFLLDHRTHPTQSLISDRLSDAQGPALLAYNNAIFQADDWIALQNISESSKRADTSKIGKYGIGFRSCYHVTDTPQILSDQYLVVFDPHHAFSTRGGVKKDLSRDRDMYSDHIRAMNINILGGNFPDGVLEGTIIRLPLRRDATQSEISEKMLTPQEIRQLLLDFVHAELEVVMLFLSHVRSVSLLEIDDNGVRHLGEARITRLPIGLSGDVSGMRQETVSVSLTCGNTEIKHDWRVVHNNRTIDEGSEILSGRLGRDVSGDLRREKLSPSVSLAFPISLTAPARGRLFTYLPLPLPTGFPCHIHSLFALAPSRQNLRNPFEAGIVPGARDELLVEWNKVLFDVFVARAWAVSLEELVKDLSDPSDIWQAWPPPSQDTPGGDPSYWRCLLRDLIYTLQDEQRTVWPLVGRIAFACLSSVLVSTSSADERYFAALEAAGLQITAPPPYVVQTMATSGLPYSQLTPPNACRALLERTSQLCLLQPQVKDMIRGFLLSTADAALVAGLPVISLANGTYIALERKGSSPEVEYVLLSDDEVSIFQACTARLIRISQLPAAVVSSAPVILNVVALGCPQVIGFIDAVTNNLERPARLLWLRRFWAWFATWTLRDQLFDLVTSHAILIANDYSFHPLSAILFSQDGINNDFQAVSSQLGIRFLDASFPPAASAYLKQKAVLKSANDISVLLFHSQTSSMNWESARSNLFIWANIFPAV